MCCCCGYPAPPLPIHPLAIEPRRGLESRARARSASQMDTQIATEKRVAGAAGLSPRRLQPRLLSLQRLLGKRTTANGSPAQSLPPTSLAHLFAWLAGRARRLCRYVPTQPLSIRSFFKRPKACGPDRKLTLCSALNWIASCVS